MLLGFCLLGGFLLLMFVRCWEFCFAGRALLLGGFFAGGCFAARVSGWEFFVWLGSISNSNSRCHSNSNIARMVLVVVLVHVILIVISSKSNSSTESAQRSQSLLILKEAGNFHFPRYKYAVTAAW